MITEFVEPLLRPVAEKAEVSSEDLAIAWGGEGAGVVSEVIFDYFTKGWMNVALNAVTGLVTLLGAVLSPRMTTRTKRELLQWSAHCLGRIPVKLTQEWDEIAGSWVRFQAAVKKGDWNAALASGFKAPAEKRVVTVRQTTTPVKAGEEEYEFVVKQEV